MPEVKGKHNQKGKYAEFASKLLAAAYAVQFDLPYLVILEDDVVFSDLGKQIKSAVVKAKQHDKKILDQIASGALTRDNCFGAVIKLSKWGEGYMFSRLGAETFIHQLYRRSINHHSDVWIRKYLHPLHHDVKYHLIVKPNDGNIYYSQRIYNPSEFCYYASSNDASPLFQWLLPSYSSSSSINATITASITKQKHQIVHPLMFRSREDTDFSEVVQNMVNVDPNGAPVLHKKGCDRNNFQSSKWNDNPISKNNQ